MRILFAKIVTPQAQYPAATYKISSIIFLSPFFIVFFHVLEHRLIMTHPIFVVNKIIHLLIIYCPLMSGIMNKRGDSMIGERIRKLRERAKMSQSELAKRLTVTRSSVNAWESGLSAPTAAYLIELAKTFHVSTDYLLGIESGEHIDLSGLTAEEIHILHQLLDYFFKGKN